MSATDFRRRLAERAAVARVTVTSHETDQLEKYFDLLSRWNARMNLTALPLEGLADKTMDRLFIEPLAASRYVQKSPMTWFDVGSGGGSPALPLKIVRPKARLTMVESKGRKAAFLREAVRSLELESTEVKDQRFELLLDAKALPEAADLITVRAVRTDDELLGFCHAALRRDGELLLFQSEEAAPTSAGFKIVRTVQLTQAPAFLTVLRAIDVPRGTMPS